MTPPTLPTLLHLALLTLSFVHCAGRVRRYSASRTDGAFDRIVYSGILLWLVAAMTAGWVIRFGW